MNSFVQSATDREESSEYQLSVLERQVVGFFVDGVKVLGLPKSLGEIYGLMFVAAQPLSLDDVVSKLNLSKGSASQGLRMLRKLGALKEVNGHGGRKTLYQPDVDLKRLVGGFIREEVRPHLESGKGKVGELMTLAAKEEDKDLRKHYRARIMKLEAWMTRGRVVLPLLQRMLGE